MSDCNLNCGRSFYVETFICKALHIVVTVMKPGHFAEMLACHVRLTVRDDGPGVNAVTSQPGSGTGLRNTRERLSQLYGTEAELHIGDGPAGGTIVRIDIPLARRDRDLRAND